MQNLNYYDNQIIYQIIDDGSMSSPIGRTGYNDSIRINEFKNSLSGWYIPADIDELHHIQPFKSFGKLIQDCEIEEADFVKSDMIDRVTVDFKLPKNIDLAIPIQRQFSLETNITKNIMEAYDWKCILLKTELNVGEGHHNVQNADKYKKYSKIFTTQHYKWFGDVLATEKFKMEQRIGTKLNYYKEQQRLLENSPFKKETQVIFTIVDKFHKKEAYICLKNAMKYNKNCDFRAIILDEDINYDINFKNINFITFENKNEIIYTKYHSQKDSLRWSLKPLLISKLLEEYDKVIYLDSDILFVNPWAFLFDDINGVLLTKHNRSLNPMGKEYAANFTDGFFNAGFIGASKSGLEAINWWKSAVEWKCEKNTTEGLWDDQKYLDIMALAFNETVSICKHNGCNIAAWNSSVFDIGRDSNRWFIKNDQSDIIFLHLTSSSYRSKEPVLKYYTAKAINQQNKYEKFNNLFT
jgi:lipopolysaccharide biosynthesis glycosyltransferase